MGQWALTLWPILWGGLARALALIPLFACLTALEVFLPVHGVRPSWRSRGRSALFWLAGAPAGALAATIAAIPIQALRIHPVLATWTLPFLPPIAGAVLGGALAAVFGDFFYYWYHRAQHRFLWRFHAVHHSVREMSGMSGYHHFTEIAFQGVIYGIPVALIAPDPFAVPVVGGLMAAWAHYLHSPTQANLGRAWRVVVDNRFHRVHHSLEPRHWDKNFGVVVTIWDRLFGTAVFPAPEEWPETGIPGHGEVATLADYFLMPFRWRRRARAVVADVRA